MTMVIHSSNFLLQWPVLFSHTLFCSPGIAEQPDCWLGCWDLAHPAGSKHTHTHTTNNSKQIGTKGPEILKSWLEIKGLEKPVEM